MAIGSLHRVIATVAPGNVGRHRPLAGFGGSKPSCGAQGVSPLITVPGANLSVQRAIAAFQCCLFSPSKSFFERFHGCSSSCDRLDIRRVRDGTEGQVPVRSNSCAVCIQWSAIRSIMVLCSSRFARSAQREHCAAKARYSLGERSAERMIPTPTRSRFRNSEFEPRIVHPLPRTRKLGFALKSRAGFPMPGQGGRLGESL